MINFRNVAMFDEVIAVGGDIQVQIPIRDIVQLKYIQSESKMFCTKTLERVERF